MRHLTWKMKIIRKRILKRKPDLLSQNSTTKFPLKLEIKDYIEQSSPADQPTDIQGVSEKKDLGAEFPNPGFGFYFASLKGEVFLWLMHPWKEKTDKIVRSHC